MFEARNRSWFAVTAIALVACLLLFSGGLSFSAGIPPDTALGEAPILADINVPWGEYEHACIPLEVHGSVLGSRAPPN